MARRGLRKSGGSHYFLDASTGRFSESGIRSTILAAQLFARTAAVYIVLLLYSRRRIEVVRHSSACMCGHRLCMSCVVSWAMLASGG